MRIPDWTPEAKPQPAELVNAILARRGGQLINLDKALLWSEPLARGWNTYLKAVRTELPTSPRLRELAICTVALLTGALYEYHHHAPDFLAAGGTQAELDALDRVVAADARRSESPVARSRPAPHRRRSAAHPPRRRDPAHPVRLAYHLRPESPARGGGIRTARR